MRLRSLLFGAAIGAAIAYLFDPDRGRARRARLGDQAAALLRRSTAATGRRGRYLATTAAGRMSEARSRLTPPAPVDDATLRDRIRSEALGHARIAAGKINVDVADGRATLRGEMDDSALIGEVVARVRAVPGVVSVESLLHTPEEEPAPNKRPAVRASQRAAESAPSTGEAIE